MMGNTNYDKIRKTVEEFVLSNEYLRIVLTSYGAAVRKIDFKIGNSMFKNIAFTLAAEEAGLKNALYAGATLAPAAGRIEKGLLPLDGNYCQLTRNEQGKHHLHGGIENLSFQPWEVAKQANDRITFSASLKDGVDGYPGNREFSTEYMLKDNCLEIRLRARSDRKTYFNLSNHTYFNLNAFSSSGLDQYLTISAERAVLNNEEHIPQNAVNVAGTEFDFLSSANIEKRICAYSGSIQFQTARGLNHYFLLSKKDTSIPDCTLLSADRKTALHLYTDAPALVLYSGGFIDDSFHYEGTDGRPHSACPGCAIAIEPSNMPFSLESPHGVTESERRIRWEFYD